MFNLNQNSLYIAFNKPSYMPGEQVMGTVYLNTVNSLDAHGIELNFYTCFYFSCNNIWHIMI